MIKFCIFLIYKKKKKEIKGKKEKEKIVVAVKLCSSPLVYIVFQSFETVWIYEWFIFDKIF